jgi:ribosome-dependent ATPase
MANFTLLLLMALFVFHVPLRGSFPVLLIGVLIYVTAMTAYGMLISVFTKTQIAALFGTAILTVLPATQFAGMMTPVSSLAAGAQIMGRAFPMTYFVPISVGAFTKGLGIGDLWTDLVALAVFVPVLALLSVLILARNQGIAQFPA